MTGYELGYQMGIKIDRVKEPFPLPSKIVTDDCAAGRRRRGDRHGGVRAVAERRIWACGRSIVC